MVASTEASTTSTRFVRRQDGQVVAIEVLEVERWHAGLERPVEPLEPRGADARLVRLAHGRPPHDLPRWLHAEAVGRRVAESAPVYGSDAAVPNGPSSATLRALAEAVPLEPPGDWTVEDFAGAGASAALHPSPVPAEHERRLAVVRRFCLDRAWPLGALPEIDGDALEWRLHRWFGDPDRFADAILLARLMEEQPEVAEGLARLRRSTVPPDTLEHTELRLDRDALLEQLSPWRCLECSDARTALAAPLAALRAWQLRYDAAVRAHRQDVKCEASSAARLLEGVRREARALERLNRLDALGAADGTLALARHASLVAEVASDAGGPACVDRLGEATVTVAAAEAVVTEVRQALEVRRTRLASAVARLVLERDGGGGLDGLLQALQASEVDGLHRILDDTLLARLEQMLGESSTRAPLEEFLERWPAVRGDQLQAVVEAFRAALEGALAASPDGVVALR